MSISLLRRLLMKEAVKDTAGSSGIMSINKNIAAKVEQQLQKYVDDAMRQGVDLDTLSPEQLKMIVQMNKPKPPRVIPADSPEGRQITEQLFGKQKAPVFDMEGNRIPEESGIMGGKSINDLIQSGDVTKGTVTKKSKKVTDREMFKAANERLTSDVDSIIKNIKSMEPITAMKEANSVIARKGKYKNLTPEQSKKILQDTEDHIFERDIPEDPEDFASGGRAGLKDGNTPIVTIDDKIDEMISFYQDYLKKGGKMDFKTFSKKYIPENFATGGRAGYSIGDRVMPSNDFINLGLGNMTQGQNTQTAGLLDIFKDTPEEKALEQIQELRDKENQIKGLGEGAIELKQDELKGIEQQIQDLKNQYPDDEDIQQAFDPYAGIQGQTAFLDPFTVVGGLIKIGKGAKASALAKEFLKNKAKQKVGSTIFDKVQKKINPPKYPQGPSNIKTGGGGGFSQANVGGGNTAKNSLGQTAAQATAAGTGTSQGYSQHYADGGRAGFFMGSRPAVQKGLSTLKEMLKYFGKKSDRVENPSDILKIVNPKRLNKLLEDPNIYRKFDVEKGIAAPDLIKNMQKQMMGDRQKTIEEMLGAAKNIKSADDNIIKYKNEMIEDMLKKGVDREMAEEMAETISKMAKGASGKFDDTPKLTDEGVMQLENILKDMETGGKAARELNATGGRIGYKDGPKMNRRTFMKYLAGFASLPIIGKIVKPLKTVKGVKNVPIIKTGDVPGKPEWFDALVNKVIIEGDDVTKKFATQDRQVVYSKKIDADNEVTVYRDLDTDSVRVDYSSPDVMLDEPVSLSYTRGQADEATQGMKPADEFETFEQGLAARSNGPDDYSIDPEPNVGSSISSLETDVSKLKEYATGKKPTMKEFVASKKRKDRVRKINEGDIGEISDYATKRQGDYYDYDDYASGGIARMLGE